MRHIIILSLIVIFSSAIACNPVNLWQNDDKKDVSEVISLNNITVEVTYNYDVEETSAEDPANYSIEGLQVVGARRDGLDLNKVSLETSSQSAIQYTLVVTNVEREDGDIVDNTNDNDTFTGDSLPAIVSVSATSNTGIDIVFSEGLDSASAEDLGNYTVAGLGISDAVYDDNNTVHLVTDPQELMEYSLTADNILDLTGNTMSQDIRSFLGYFFSILDVVVIDNTHVDVVFSGNVNEASAEVASNYLIDNGLNVVSAARDDADSRIVHLVTASQTDLNYSIEINNVKSMNNEVLVSPDNTRSFTGDALPEILNVYAVSNTGVEIIFSENLDPVTALNTGNYSISGLGVLSASYDNDVMVSLITESQESVTYTLSVTNVTDVTGNTIVPINNYFTGNFFCVSGASAQDNTHVDVTFSKNVDLTSSQNPANYSISGGVSVSSAVRDAGNNRIVHLTTSSQSGTGYTLIVSGIVSEDSESIPYPYDTVSFAGDALPYVTNVHAESNTTVRVDFSEAMTSPASGNYTITGLTVNSVTVYSSTTVILNTEGQIFTDYTLVVSNITDLNGNMIVANSNTFSGYYFCLANVTAIDNTHVDVLFSNDVTLSSSQNPGNYIFSGLTASSATRDAGNNMLVHLVTSSQLGIEYDLDVYNVTSVNGESMFAPDNHGTFDGDALPGVASVDRISCDEIDVIFTEDVEIISASDPNNYDVIGDITLDVTSASVSGNTVTLFLSNGYNQANTDYHVYVSDVRDMTGNVIDANDTVFAGDALPRVTGASWNPDANVDLFFSESVNPAYANDPSNYIVSGGLSVTSATAAGSVVHLLIENQSDGPYTMTVDYMEDLTGNPIHPSYTDAGFTGNASPYVISADNNGSMMVDVEFSEEMINNASTNGVLNTSNYSITDITNPANIISVTFVSYTTISNIAHLTLSDSLDTGHNYEITFSTNIEDIDENDLIDPLTHGFSYP